MESIKQKPRSPAVPTVPDFRNLGVILRVLLLVNLLALLTVLLRGEMASEVLADRLIVMAGQVEPPLFLAVLLLYALGPALQLAGPRWAPGIVLAAALGAVLLAWPLFSTDGAFPGQELAWAAGAAVVALLYFDYRQRLYSPALTEARLLALTARIRPHFLFNSINGVLGVIRSDPRRAERALEELADLFRVLMRDNRELVPLAEELLLCERYLDLERLRLGDRLNVRWEIDPPSGDGTGPEQALVLPLLLQPLLENAVYHGIEPCEEEGEIVVRVQHRGKELRLEVDNPLSDTARQRAGNQMALDNIRERLTLFFDIEAGLHIQSGEGRYRVRLHLPFRSVTP
ncbi:sensor histidine kinase [Azoarcus indigens]|uniref:Two-component system sensor histidine kinase AlgZ n=1 Tax=Azoarcus indigens TaxID=29545 RepID=A0A4R6DY99_9RHOO|nr:histidine kinase [Azoarcus indigens]NMG66386.1 sensor histidine kinase [Azoarcus indigens]TDN50320.1 two-component system sensor histidine kinase AlgZ [Azoarcus indigens]